MPGYSITPNQKQLLRALRGGARSKRALYPWCGYTTVGGVTKALDRLEALGLVERAGGPPGAVWSWWRATAAGREQAAPGGEGDR